MQIDPAAIRALMQNPDDSDIFFNEVYELLFGRIPDDEGLAYWTTQVESGVSYANAVLNIARSDEFQIAHPDFPELVVFSLYRLILGREPDLEGLAYWVDALQHHSPIWVAQSFVESPEFAEKFPSADAAVTQLYATFLGRGPDQEGLDYWTTELTSGTAFESIVQGFLNSPEFLEKSLAFVGKILLESSNFESPGTNNPSLETGEIPIELPLNPTKPSKSNTPSFEFNKTPTRGDPVSKDPVSTTYTVNSGIQSVSLGDIDNLIIDASATANVTSTSAWTPTDVTINNGTGNIDTNGYGVDLSAITTGNGWSVTNTGVATTFKGSMLDDRLWGGGGDDTIYGLIGSDQLYGLEGNDSLYGGADNDSLAGGEGDDYLIGNKGDDWLYGDEGDDEIYGNEDSDRLYGGNGNDTLYGGIDGDLLDGNEGNDLLYGNDGVDFLYGGGDNDSLFGGEGDDWLYGDDGVDMLYGGDGSDRLWGGAGVDTFIVNSGNDTIYDLGFGGADVIKVEMGASVYATVSANWTATTANYNYGSATLSSNGYRVDVSALTTPGNGFRITNTGAGTTLIGSPDNDTLTGGVGMDTLKGGDGNDVLDGGVDNDALTGGAGVDTFIVNSGNDTINDLGFGGADILIISDGAKVVAAVKADWTATSASTNDGTAKLESSFDVDLSAISTGKGWEVMNRSGVSTTFIGSMFNDTMWGNKGDDTIYGGNGDDEIHGGLGNDTLTGGVGMDTLKGSLGNDTLNGGFGNDSLYGQDGDDYLNGDEGDDTLYGDYGVDMLYGGDGADFLYGGDDNDSLYGGDGVDFLYGGGDNDSLFGGEGVDWLYGDDGVDMLYGGDGNDRLRGGAGVDTFIVNSGNDTIWDLGFGGADVIKVEMGASVNATVSANWTATTANYNYGTATLSSDGYRVDVSALTTPGNGFRITNTGAGTTLIGSPDNDTLTGGVGMDTLTGGDGNDNFYFGSALSTSNVDTIVDFYTSSDSIYLSKKIFTALTEKGALLSDYFIKNENGTAQDANDYVVYNTSNGNLYYDADGNGGQAAIQFATLKALPSTNNSVDLPNLTSSDFFVY